LGLEIDPGAAGAGGRVDVGALEVEVDVGVLEVEVDVRALGVEGDAG
jgi:hypothetical protein